MRVSASRRRLSFVLVFLLVMVNVVHGTPQQLQTEAHVSMEHARGALLGVFVGDAAGATLEFLDGPFSELTARQALRMPGGGIHAVGPGQVTDDSELTIALASALEGHHPSQGLPADSVARWYRAWYSSSPFDVGTTCATAFRGLGSATAMCAVAQRHNQLSESNGALIRITPLAMWMAAQPAPLVAEAARQDALLSHPSIVCQDANAAYAIAIAHLLTHPSDADGALAAAAASSYMTSVPVRHWLLEDSALSWHQLASLLDCTQKEGHLRYAFTLAFHFLRHRTPFDDAIVKTLQLGGDTDTNAAIVGGLLGALHGAQAIPSFMKDPVLGYDCSSRVGRVRPLSFCPRRIDELLDILYSENQASAVTTQEL